jgi:predicted transcriptional regulator
MEVNISSMNVRELCQGANYFWVRELQDPVAIYHDNGSDVTEVAMGCELRPCLQSSTYATSFEHSQLAKLLYYGI